MLQSKTRSKDLNTQKMQDCVLKAVGAISKVTNALLELKNSKNLNTTTLNKNLSTMVHDCTYSLAPLSQVNAGLEQDRSDHIAYYLENQYHAMKKYVPADSEFLFGLKIDLNNYQLKIADPHIPYQAKKMKLFL